MKKFEKAFIKGSFNPFQAGHLHLLNIAKDISKKTDIYIGNKQRPNLLPRGIREKAVKNNIEYNNWKSNFNLISAGKHYEINPAEYDLFITDSDLLNIMTKTISSRGIKINQIYKDFYLKFPNILIVDRKNMPLEEDAKKILKQHSNILYETCPMEISGSKIRQTYREGKDISTMVSPPTWAAIKEHIHIFA